jgi:serine/threonine protein kinase
MTARDWNLLKDIFADAIDRPAAERDAFARTACRDYPELLDDLLRMLAEHEHESSILSSPVLRPDIAATAPRFSAGDLLAGRFRVERWIASGGMGEIYEAEDLELHERVALKAIRADIAAEDRALTLFRNEIQLARRVTHPNVCRVYDLAQHETIDSAGRPRRTMLLSMEFLPGVTLAEYLRDQGPFSARDALPLIREIAAGLQAAHDRGIVHRDLKPRNIILVPSNGETGRRPVITDFGLAYSTARAAGDDPGTGGGTPEYAAPEQLRGEPGTVATDVYSFALVIADIVGLRRSGAPAADTRLHSKSGIPARWVRVLERCLAADPARRYGSATAVPIAMQGHSRRNAIAAGAALALAGSAWLSRSLLWKREPVWMVIASLDNRSGQPLLDESVPFLFERELSNSPDIYIAPRSRVEDTLRLMRRDLHTRIDETLAREVCLRDGGIQLVGSSRAERVGSGYLLTASVRDAATGRLLGGASEQLGSVEEIAPAVQRLARVMRRAAGVHPRNAASPLPHVTTPSLRACQLYSETYREGQDIDWTLAEQLSRAAVAEDPQFASAWLWLTYAIVNQRKPEELWRPPLEKAVALSSLSTDRERQFIIAAAKEMNGDAQGAIAAYRRMLTAYPDDFWARNNLALRLLASGRENDANDEFYASADLRPNDWRLAYRAMFYACVAGDAAQTLKWRERLVHLDPVKTQWNAAGTGWSPRTIEEISHWGETYRQHELWVRRRLAELKAEVDAARGGRIWKPLDARFAVAWYESLGRLRDAQDLIASPAVPNRQGESLVLAFLHDDISRPMSAAAHEMSLTPALFLSIRQDWNEARVESFLRDSDNQWWLQLPLARARLFALQGAVDEAAALIRGTLKGRPLYRGSPDLFLAASAMARGYEQVGRDADALSALELADVPLLSLYRWREGSTASLWQRLRYDRARLLRKLGLGAEAATIEADLLRSLAVGDADHPILVRLKESGRRPFSWY